MRGMWSALIAVSLYPRHSLAGVVRLLEHDEGVRTVCGFSRDNILSEYALGRFLKKLARHKDLLGVCFSRLVEQLRKILPGFGDKLHLVVDGLYELPIFYVLTPAKGDSDVGNTIWGATEK